MVASDILEKIGGSLGSSANVKTVFGEPIHAEGKTVVPVAKVAYGFGAGGGHGHLKSNGGSGEQPEGGGGGGGVRAFPAGVLEITHDRTRFVAFPNVRLILGTLGAGILIGQLFQWRR